MTKFYVDDSNADTTGPYATIEEALEDANENLAQYRSNASLDGWGLGEGDLCIYSLPDDFDPDEGEVREGIVVAKVVEFDKQPIEGGSSHFDYNCDMRMELVP